MGRTALKITLAVVMAAGLLLGVSGCGKSAEAEKQAPASKTGMEKGLRVGCPLAVMENGQILKPHIRPFYSKTNMDTMSDSKWILLRR